MVVKRPMVEFLTQLLLAIRSLFKTRARLEAEILVFRQQLIVLSRKAPARVRLRNTGHLLFLWLYTHISAASSSPTLPTTIKSGLIGRWTRTPPSFGRHSPSATSLRFRYSEGYITIMRGFELSVSSVSAKDPRPGSQ
jgi:hypothetical protein